MHLKLKFLQIMSKITDVGILETPTPLASANVGNGDTPSPLAHVDVLSEGLNLSSIITEKDQN